MEFEFSSNPNVAALEELPDHIRPFYSTEAGDEGYALREEFGPAAQAFDALNKSLSASRKLEKAIKSEKLQPWLELGESPDAVRGQIEELKAELKDSVQNKSGVNMDKLKQEFEVAKNNITSEAEKTIAEMKASLHLHMVNSQAAMAIAAEKGDVELLMPHVLKHADLVNEDGDWQVRVVDSANDPRGDGKGGFMTIADLVKEMKSSPSLGRAFDAIDRAGADVGANGRDSSRSSGTRMNGENLSPTQKISEGLSIRGV